MSHLLILIWIAIGTILRFTNLAAKPPWTDEITTIIYSLGNNYQSVPLNQIINLETLLQPLQFNADAGISQVITSLLREDVHPPIYFILSHLWMKLFPHYDYASVWIARSLPALIGILSIPAIYWLAKLTFRSRSIAHCSAAMMAVSPYGIFLAQEARHYTLAIIFVILSLACLIIAVKNIWRHQQLPIWLVLLWVIVNSLGLATHYFFSLTLCAEIIVLLCLIWHLCFHKNDQIKNNQKTSQSIFRNLPRLAFIALGTLASGLVWLPNFVNNQITGGHTDWIQGNSNVIMQFINPIFQSLAAWITMICLLPVEANNLGIIITSGLVMLCFLIWVIPIIFRGIKQAYQNDLFSLGTKALVIFIGSGITLFFMITYFLRFDLTRGARYNFVYFPAVIILLGVILDNSWNDFKVDNQINDQKSNEYQSQPNLININIFSQGKISVVIILLMAFLSGITVVTNFGYQKYYRPDLLAPLIHSSSPALIATTHTTLAHKGELIGLGWELKQQKMSEEVNFLLVDLDLENPQAATLNLQQSISKIIQPLDLWLVNFNAPVELQNCLIDEHLFPKVDGYEYQLYHCSRITKATKS